MRTAAFVVLASTATYLATKYAVTPEFVAWVCTL